MIDINKLRGAIHSNGMTQGQLANEMGISEQTLSRKMKKGIFTNTEMDLMIRILNITDPASIFFQYSSVISDRLTFLPSPIQKHTIQRTTGERCKFNALQKRKVIFMKQIASRGGDEPWS